MCLVSCVGVSALLVSPTLAQVNGPGPSPSELFDTVLNLPGDEGVDLPGSDEVVTSADEEAIGGLAGETVQLNVTKEGFVDGGLKVLFDSEVNISGGTVRGRVSAFRGSELNISGGYVSHFSPFASSVANISGGTVGRFISPYSNEVKISGGTFGPNFWAGDESGLELIGSEFRLNGVDFSGSTITINGDDVFTGTLADGSPFIFTASVFVENFIAEYDRLSNVTLTAVALPAADLNPIVVNSPIASSPSGLRAGQTLTLQAGGSLPDYFAIVDATLNVEGGSLGDRAEASNSVVNISGGNVGFFNGYADSVVNISGGNVDRFRAYIGAAANISGGTVGDGFIAVLGSDVQLIGGEFRLNGADFPGGAVSLMDDDVFTGTLADGSSFIFSDADSDELILSLTAAALPAADSSPIVISAPVVSGPSGLRAGQTLTLQTGGSLRDNFAAVGATLNVEGGIVGEGAEASESVVNICGGNVGSRFDAFSGSEVNISGGTVGDDFEAHTGSVVNISGGAVGTFDARYGSEVNISGGTLDSFDALSGSVLNISGGAFGEEFHYRPASIVNLFGSEFSIDGEPLDDLVPGETFTITNENQTLSGIFIDGKPFSFNLTSAFRMGTLTVETGPVILGDVNRDGDVDFSDISPFVEVLFASGFQAEADCNEDGVVSFRDIPVFIGILSST